MAIMTSAIVNMWAATPGATKPADYMPDFWKQHQAPARPRQTAAEMWAVLMQGTKAAGGKVIERKAS